MTHSYHDALPGYDERQILHDGCRECQDRGKDVRKAISHLDSMRFRHAWKRAFDLWSSGGDHDALGNVSNAELKLLEALWAVQVRLEQEGYALDGRLPRFVPRTAYQAGTTPEVQSMVRDLLEGWQDTSTFIQLHGLLQANILSPTLQLGNGNLRPPAPDALRQDAADLRCVADGMAQFLEHLAERVEAKGNGHE